MPSEDATVLVDMGFSLRKVEIALEATGNKGVEQAMEWLLAHTNDPEPEPVACERPVSDDTADTRTESSGAGASNETPAATDSAKSLKCDVCNKLFKTTLEIEYHAAKSGHDSFSESTEEKKPLTDEEKKEKLKELEEKMRQKRKEREEQEKREEYEKEKNRIKSGKEMAEAKRKFAELEMQRIIEQRKREKEEEKEARQRVRAQIEADKAARRAKASSELGKAPPVLTTIQPATSPTNATSTPKQDYKETTLMIRLTNGQSLVQNFGCKEPLSAVRLFVEMNRTDLPGSFSLMTSFPRKIFKDEDYDTPLDVLGLVPSAVIIVQKEKESAPRWE